MSSNAGSLQSPPANSNASTRSSGIDVIVTRMIIKMLAKPVVQRGIDVARAAMLYVYLTITDLFLTALVFFSQPTAEKKSPLRPQISITSPTATVASLTDLLPKQNKDAESESTNDNKATEELSAVIDDLLSQLGAKFSTVSEELLGKMDEMSRRLDNLEAAIQAGKGGDNK